MSMKGLTFSHNVPLGSPAAYTETGLASLLEDLKEVKASIQALNIMLMYLWKIPELIINLIVKIRLFVNMLT